jgi:hypothetical protein
MSRIYAPDPITGPTQFDGLTEATGLFLPGQTGGQDIVARVKAITWSGWTSTTSWEWISFNPETGQEALIHSDSTTSLKVGGPGGFQELNVNVDGISWGYKFITTGMVGTGRLHLAWNFVPTTGG